MSTSSPAAGTASTSGTFENMKTARMKSATAGMTVQMISIRVFPWI